MFSRSYNYYTHLTLLCICGLFSHWDALYFRIFETHPAIKILFGFENSTVEELKMSTQLQDHGKRIMRTIDFILNAIFVSCDIECDDVKDVLGDLGRKHVQFNMKPQYISVSIIAI